MLIGKEPTWEEDQYYWECIVMDSKLREITCPDCGEVKNVEPDATYTYMCEGCYEKVKVPTPEIG
jgi:ribosomal protein S27E